MISLKHIDPFYFVALAPTIGRRPKAFANDNDRVAAILCMRSSPLVSQSGETIPFAHFNRRHAPASMLPELLSTFRSLTAKRG